MKIISKLLVSILIFSLLPLGLVYGTVTFNAQTSYDSASDDSNTATTFTGTNVQWQLTRTQKKINRFFAEQSFSGQLESTESQLIGNISVENNTRDGYQVHILSSNDGILLPHSTTDGEQAIAYELAFSYSGSKASQIHSVSAPLDAADFTAAVSDVVDADYGVLILGLSDTNLKCSGPTDMDIAITLGIDSVTAFKMAGTYSDTLTISYKDL